MKKVQMVSFKKSLSNLKGFRLTQMYSICQNFGSMLKKICRGVSKTIGRKYILSCKELEGFFDEIVNELQLQNPELCMLKNTFGVVVRKFLN